jgi:hypothetical protein
MIHHTPLEEQLLFDLSQREGDPMPNDYERVSYGSCDMCYVYGVPMIEFTNYNPSPNQTMTCCADCLRHALLLLEEAP